MSEQMESREVGEQIQQGMRPGLRMINNDAQLEVVISNAVPPHMKFKTREIIGFYVKPEMRRKRLATMLLNLVCQEADANRMTLILLARPAEEDGISEDQLVEFYQKFGFNKLQETPEGTFMARQVVGRAKVVVVQPQVTEAVRRAMRLH